MFWLLHMLLKYLSGPIFQIAVCMAGADLLAIVLACFVDLKCSLICGYIIAFMGGVTLLHRAIHVHYDIDGFFTDVPHVPDGELPFYRQMRVLATVARFGVSWSGMALFIALYDE